MNKQKPIIKTGSKILYRYASPINPNAKGISEVAEVLDYSVIVNTPFGKEEVNDKDILEVLN